MLASAPQDNDIMQLESFSIIIALAALFSMLKHLYDKWIPINLVLADGELRGGISVAQGISIPLMGRRDIFIFITYIIVVFSIFV